MNFLKTLSIILIVAIVLIFTYLFGKPYFQKKTFKTKIEKNRIERCKSRETNNCNSKRKVCKLYDKKSNEECQSEFNKCKKESALKCEDET